MTARPLLAAALALTALASASAETSIELEVYSLRRRETPGPVGERVEPYWRPVSLDDEGRARLARLCVNRFGEEEAYRSHTWRIFQRLTDPRVAEAMIAAASVSGDVTIRVRVNPFDRRRSLRAGERILLPVGGGNTTPYQVRSGDTFARIARRLLAAMEARGLIRGPLAELTPRQRVEGMVQVILDANGLRFQAWPAVNHRGSARQFIQFGEYAYRRRGRVRPDHELERTLVHEAGHLGDANHCGDTGYYYGPDRNHAGTEVLTPQAAFAEGWAHYQSLRVSRRLARRLGPGLLSEGLASEAPRRDLTPDQVTVRHQVANEYFVARALVRLEAFSSREAVEEAFRGLATEIRRVQCVTLADLLRVFHRQRPGIPLEAMLRQAFGENDPEGLATLAGGELPDGVERTANPTMNMIVLEPEAIVVRRPAPAEAPTGPFGL